MDDNNHNYITDETIAAFLDGNVSHDEMLHILSSLGDDREVSEIISLSQAIDQSVEDEKNRVLPMWALAASNRENLCSFECEAFILQHLDYDIDHWTLLEEAKANNWVREEGTPLHLVGKLLELKGMYVERKYDATLEDLEAVVDSGKQVIAVIDRNVIDSVTDVQAPSYHAIYVTGVDDGDVEYLNLETLMEEDIAGDTFMEAWKVSGYYMVAASETASGYNPQPIDVADIDLDANLEELTEAIAENAHDIWARARMDEGWTYGPERNDRLKKHPDLVPYTQLPDSEKEYDRLMAMNTLRLVHRLGYKIITPNH
ncbi:MAG: RyR domain-containing protein [Clostridiales bacterium]|nr:RyR domain-containing protein [Clostridiales bacterium]